MWECPDLFPLGDGKHVLLYSTERKVYWESGELDPKELVFHTEKRGLLDHGAFYAPKSQLDAEGRRILWGWVTETRQEAEFRAAGWAGCMSLPRVLTLADDGSLRMSVLPEIARLREAEMSIPAKMEDKKSVLEKIEFKTGTAEIELQFQPKHMHLKISDGTQDILDVRFNPEHSGQEFQIGDTAVAFPGAGAAPHRLRVFLDGSVVEAFLNDQLAWTSRTYRAPNANLTMQIPEEDLAAVVSLRPISRDRLTT